jgi:hypothetical protein
MTDLHPWRHEPRKPLTASAEDRFWRFVKKAGDDECWLWQGGTNIRGYGRFRRGRASEGMAGAHRFSYELHNGPAPSDRVVMHSCDNPQCVNPKHLSLGTHLDNSHDRSRKGRDAGLFVRGEDARRQKGAQHPSAKLTEADVLAIRTDDRTHRQIASHYGVDRTLIGLIKRRKVWKHV